MSASCWSARSARSRPCAIWPRAAPPPRSCWPAATARRRRRRAAASRRCARRPADAAARPEHDRAGQPGRRHRALGQRRAGGRRAAAGPVALVSQSGGILGSVLSRAAAAASASRGWSRPATRPISTVADFVEYLVDDDATAVIALYLEGLRDPDALPRARAQRARRRGKPIVAFKVGRSEPARGRPSRTPARWPGADRMYDALFRQHGVIRAETFADLLDIPGALAPAAALRGRRVAVLTSTGGAGALVADSLRGGRLRGAAAGRGDRRRGCAPCRTAARRWPTATRWT